MKPAVNLLFNLGVLLLHFVWSFPFALVECQANLSGITNQPVNKSILAHERGSNNSSSNYGVVLSNSENCNLNCPIGTVRTPSPYHSPSSNGCGSYGLKLEKKALPDEEFENCCNLHDICYDTCDAHRNICDMKFKFCLLRVCKGKGRTDSDMKSCKGVAKFMHRATEAFGCSTYQQSQKEACYCKVE